MRYPVDDFEVSLIKNKYVRYIFITEVMRERRGCAVVKVSEIGNCTKTEVNYEEQIVASEICYCDYDLCNGAINFHNRNAIKYFYLEMVLLAYLMKYS